MASDLLSSGNDYTPNPTSQAGIAPTGVSIVTDGLPMVTPNSYVPPCAPSGSTCTQSEPNFVDYLLYDPDGAKRHMVQTDTNDWMSRDATGYVLNTASSILTDRHGTRFMGTSIPPMTFEGQPFGPTTCCGQFTSIEDSNGNRITPNYVSAPDGSGYTLQSWTDTIGRTIPEPPLSQNWGSLGSGVASDVSNCTGPKPIPLRLSLDSSWTQWGYFHLRNLLRCQQRLH